MKQVVKSMNKIEQDAIDKFLAEHKSVKIKNGHRAYRPGDIRFHMRNGGLAKSIADQEDAA